MADTTMSTNRLADLLLLMECEFLQSPELKLTARDARRRFRVDEWTCEAILDALVDAAVLYKTPACVYRRRFRRCAEA